MKYLISMTDFVLEQKLHLRYEQLWRGIYNYAKFLKQPLELWMFVPCDEDGNVFEEPDQNNTKYDVYISNDEVDCDYRLYDEDCLEYQKSKERCLFDGFESLSFGDCLSITKDNCNLNIIKGNIEDLIDSFDNIQLTKTAEKQIGL